MRVDETRDDQPVGRLDDRHRRCGEVATHGGYLSVLDQNIPDRRQMRIAVAGDNPSAPDQQRFARWHPPFPHFTRQQLTRYSGPLSSARREVTLFVRPSKG